MKNQANRPLSYGSFGSVFESMAEKEERGELGHEEKTENTLRENSHEITSEFSCAPATDNIDSFGDTYIVHIHFQPWSHTY